MYILGINSVYHESSACLLKDGQVVAAVEEERLNRIKHAKKALYTNPHELPYRAISYCLQKAGIKLKDVSHIGYSFSPDERLSGNISLYDNDTPECRFRRNMEEIIFYTLLQTTESQLTADGAENVHPKLIKSIGLLDDISEMRRHSEFHFIGHHVCHAYSAFAPSGFENAAILTIDGIGEKSATWMGDGRGDEIFHIKSLDYPDSLGFLFERITEYLGFQKNSDEYKVAGLAAYGQQDPAKNRFYKLMKDNIIELLPDGEYRINNGVMQFRQPLRQSGLVRLFGEARKYNSQLELNGRFVDIAAALQMVLDETVLHCARYLHAQTRANNLVYAGGVALNCATNMELYRQSPFTSIFIQPAANDAGTAMGAALYVHHRILKNKTKFRMTHVYFGPEYDSGTIENELKKKKLAYYPSDDIASDTAKFLIENKVVAWFQGGLEWGPRALGSRSIIGNPADPEMKNRLNEIKGRESFRPLSPSVLEDFQGDWFEEDFFSPYMLFAFKSKTDQVAGKKRHEWICSALHVDGTARLQTVAEKENPLYYRMIKMFAKLTESGLGIPGGIPMVINTSFNTQGLPIVATLDDALRCFYTEPIDVLVAGKFIVCK